MPLVSAPCSCDRCNVSGSDEPLGFYLLSYPVGEYVVSLCCECLETYQIYVVDTLTFNGRKFWGHITKKEYIK